MYQVSNSDSVQWNYLCLSVWVLRSITLFLLYPNFLHQVPLLMCHLHRSFTFGVFVLREHIKRFDKWTMCWTNLLDWILFSILYVRFRTMLKMLSLLQILLFFHLVQIVCWWLCYLRSCFNPEPHCKSLLVNLWRWKKIRKELRWWKHSIWRWIYQGLPSWKWMDLCRKHNIRKRHVLTHCPHSD